MYTGQLIISQVTEHLPMHKFRPCVQSYQGERYVKRFRCFGQYISMAFAQLTYWESLRDIEACLRAHQSKLYHMCIRSRVVRSTPCYANEQRDWRIYADFAQALIRIARPLYAEEDLGLELDNTVYALDASTIDLCLSIFPWGLFRSTKSAVKLHTLLDLRGNNFTIPAQTVADLYRYRWQVELFFKWIKPHLRIKSFFGMSENAVKTQMWIAISVYVLVAIIKKRLNLSTDLCTILQILSLTFSKKILWNRCLRTAITKAKSAT